MILEVAFQAGVYCGSCNPSKWKADIWGWLEVRRSAMLHYTVNQRPHWACRQYGHPGGTRGWLGVKRYQLCKRDTSHSTKWYRRAAVGHWDSLCVKCSGMVDSAKMAIYLYPGQYTEGSRLMQISLLRISLLRFFKTITKIWLMRFYGLFILLLRT